MLIVSTVFAVAGLMLAFAIGLFFGHHASDGASLNSERGKLRDLVNSLTNELTAATASLSAAREENANLDKRVIGLTRHYLDQTERMRVVDQLRADAETRSRELESEISVLKDRGRHLAAKLTARTAENVEKQKNPATDFSNSAGRVQNAQRGDLSKPEDIAIFHPVNSSNDGQTVSTAK